MKNLNISLALMIIDHRKKLSLSQEELGNLVGIHRTYISQLERGLKTPTLQIIFRLSDAFGISPHIFIKEIEEKLNAL